MSLKMALRWKNPDSSADINLRAKGVFAKGFVTGGNIVPSLVSLQVDVEPFVLVNFDGAVVVSDANETVTVADGQINYVVCRARYREGDSEILAMQALTQAQYLADAEADWLHVVGVVDLSVGGPYAAPPVSSILYTERDTVDQQDRSFWRNPVDTFASLPTGSANFNRDGDVRLTLDTGSLYRWNATLSIWDTFSEGPLNTHRDLEHTNGITAASDPTTLQPDVSGTNMRVGAVPAGSYYTVNGRLLTSPSVVTDISAASVGALRGLVQVALNELGTFTSNYRVQKSPDILDISYARIIGISDDHPVGTFTLVYDNIGGTLTWAGGPPVTATPGTAIRLYDPTGVNWIDMDLTGLAPGGLVSDNYDVNANLKSDDYLLVGQWYWDGAGVLVLGTDKRTFGNLGYPEMADDFKTQEFHPRWEDLRGNMIYEGGDVADLGGLSARVQGPIIAYIEGVRYEVAGAYNGITLVDDELNYIYVDNTGTLQSVDNTTSPGGPTGSFATVAEVTTLAGAITVITDTRDPQLIVGNATRNADVQFAADRLLRWAPGASQDVVSFFRSGSVNDVLVDVGGLYANDASIGIVSSGDIVGVAGAVVATTAGRWTDNGAGVDHRFESTSQTQDVYVARGTDQDISDVMVGDPSPSLLGALERAQTHRSFRRGVESGLVVSRVDNNNVEIADGVLHDSRGRRVELTGGPTNIPVGADGTFAVYWDASAGAFNLNVIASGFGLLAEDEPLAIVVRSGGVILSSPDGIFDVRRIATGNASPDVLTVGPTSIGTGRGGEFDSVEQALLYVSCFGDGLSAGGLKVAGTISVLADSPLTFSGTVGLGEGLDFTQARWVSPADIGQRLNGLTIKGSKNAYGDVPELSWDRDGPGIDFGDQEVGKNWKIENVKFVPNFGFDPTDDDQCIFKNPGHSFYCAGVEVNGNAVLTHLVAYTNSATQLGGKTTETSQTVFERCSFYGFTGAGSGQSLIWMDAGSGGTAVGSMTFRDCYFHSSFNPTNGFIEVITNQGTPAIVTCDFYSENCHFDVGFTNYMISHDRGVMSSSAANTQQSAKVFNRCTFTNFGAGASIAKTDSALGSSDLYSEKADFSDCNFGDGADLYGARTLTSCYASGGAAMIGAVNVRLVGCDFFSDGSFSGTLANATSCDFQIPGSGIVTILNRQAPAFPLGPVSGTATGCRFFKLDPVNNPSTVIATISTGSSVNLTDCYIECEDSSGTPSSDIVVQLGARTTLTNCRIEAPVDGICIGDDAGSSLDLTVTGCQMDIKSGGSFYSQQTNATADAVKIFADNRCEVTAVTGATLFETVGLGAGDKVAHSILFKNNTIHAPNGMSGDIVNFEDVDHVSITGNVSLVVKNTPINQFNRYVVGGAFTAPEVCVFSDNTARVTQASIGEAYSNVVITATRVAVDANILEGYRSGVSINWLAITATNATSSANIGVNTGGGGSLITTGGTDNGDNVVV